MGTLCDIMDRAFNGMPNTPHRPEDPALKTFRKVAKGVFLFIHPDKQNHELKQAAEMATKIFSEIEMTIESQIRASGQLRAPSSASSARWTPAPPQAPPPGWSSWAQPWQCAMECLLWTVSDTIAPTPPTHTHHT